MLKENLHLLLAEEGLIEVRGGGEPIKTTYSRGEAWLYNVNLKPGELAVQVRLVRGLRGRVRGYIAVYDSSGVEVYRVVIRKLKIRPSRGDIGYHWVVERVVEKLGLHKYLKRYKFEEKRGRQVKPSKAKR
jgi:hypothetical protein